VRKDEQVAEAVPLPKQVMSLAYVSTAVKKWHTTLPPSTAIHASQSRPSTTYEPHTRQHMSTEDLIPHLSAGKARATHRLSSDTSIIPTHPHACSHPHALHMHTTASHRLERALGVLIAQCRAHSVCHCAQMPGRVTCDHHLPGRLLSVPPPSPDFRPAREVIEEGAWPAATLTL
jgi:hypothetical protein